MLKIEDTYLYLTEYEAWHEIRHAIINGAGFSYFRGAQQYPVGYAITQLYETRAISAATHDRMLGRACRVADPYVVCGISPRKSPEECGLECVRRCLADFKKESQ